jgi:hypothetical protein
MPPPYGARNRCIPETTLTAIDIMRVKGISNGTSHHCQPHNRGSGAREVCQCSKAAVFLPVVAAGSGPKGDRMSQSKNGWALVSVWAYEGPTVQVIRAYASKERLEKMIPICEAASAAAEAEFDRLMTGHDDDEEFEDLCYEEVKARFGLTQWGDEVSFVVAAIDNANVKKPTASEMEEVDRYKQRLASDRQRRREELMASRVLATPSDQCLDSPP